MALPTQRLRRWAGLIWVLKVCKLPLQNYQGRKSGEGGGEKGKGKREKGQREKTMKSTRTDKIGKKEKISSKRKVRK